MNILENLTFGNREMMDLGIITSVLFDFVFEILLVSLQLILFKYGCHSRIQIFFNYYFDF